MDSGAAGVIAAEKQLAAAKAQLEQNEANNVKAQLDRVRYHMLVVKDEIARQEYDNAVAAAKASAKPKQWRAQGRTLKPQNNLSSRRAVH